VRLIKSGEVNGDSSGEALERLTKLTTLETLWGHEDEEGISLGYRLMELIGPGALELMTGEANDAVDPVRLHAVSLIFDERHQRSNDNRSTWETEASQLIDEALASPRWEENGAVLTGEDFTDRFVLPLSKRLLREHALQEHFEWNPHVVASLRWSNPPGDSVSTAIQDADEWVAGAQHNSRNTLATRGQVCGRKLIDLCEEFKVDWCAEMFRQFESRTGLNEGPLLLATVDLHAHGAHDSSAPELIDRPDHVEVGSEPSTGFPQRVVKSNRPHLATQKTRLACFNEAKGNSVNLRWPEKESLVVTGQCIMRVAPPCRHGLKVWTGTFPDLTSGHSNHLDIETLGQLVRTTIYRNGISVLFTVDFNDEFRQPGSSSQEIDSRDPVSAVAACVSNLMERDLWREPCGRT
jgi:hypothetical protein